MLSLLQCDLWELDNKNVFANNFRGTFYIPENTNNIREVNTHTHLMILKVSIYTNMLSEIQTEDGTFLHF